MSDQTHTELWQSEQGGYRVSNFYASITTGTTVVHVYPILLLEARENLNTVDKIAQFLTARTGIPHIQNRQSLDPQVGQVFLRARVNDGPHAAVTALQTTLPQSLSPITAGDAMDLPSELGPQTVKPLISSQTVPSNVQDLLRIAQSLDPQFEVDPKIVKQVFEHTSIPANISRSLVRTGIITPRIGEIPPQELVVSEINENLERVVALVPTVERIMQVPGPLKPTLLFAAIDALFTFKEDYLTLMNFNIPSFNGSNFITINESTPNQQRGAMFYAARITLGRL